jgi:hypothetical protein
MTGHIYYMNIYLGKDRQNIMQMMTATHAAVRHLEESRRGRTYTLHGQFLLLFMYV